MEYAEYKPILDTALTDYVKNGGSVYYMADALKEYIFSYEENPIAEDHKKNLHDKAIQAIIRKDKLPKGIKLEKCILHGMGL